MLNKQKLQLIIEAYEDIQAIIMRVRVDIDSPNDPSLQDILTTLRGLPNVITVQQDQALEPAPDGKQMASLIVKFENAPAVDIPTLRMQVEALPTVDMVTILTVDGREFDEIKGRRDAKIARDEKAIAFQKQRKLGMHAYNLNFEGNMITKKKIKKIIKEEVSRKLNETAGGHFLTGLKHEHGIGLNAQEIAATMAFVNDQYDDEGFTTAYSKDPKHGWDVTPYDIFFDYYREEMPYGTQKARDGDPYVWLFDKLRQELGLDDSVREGLLREASIEGGYEPTNVDKVYEIIQSLLDASNVGADRQGEIAMELANMYDASIENPHEILNHAEDILKTDAGYHDEDEEEEQYYAAGRPWEHN